MVARFVEWFVRQLWEHGYIVLSDVQYDYYKNWRTNTQIELKHTTELCYRQQEIIKDLESRIAELEEWRKEQPESGKESNSIKELFDEWVNGEVARNAAE